MKTCGICGWEGEDEDFASVKRGINGRRRGSTCKLCWNKMIADRHRRRKAKVIALMGGKCQQCGYRKNLSSLDLHHLDPSEKEMMWGDLSKKPWAVILSEIKKCVLLCANCHREEHHPETEIAEDTFCFPPCPGCGVAMPTGDDYCSSECMYRHRRKTERPPKEDLEQMLSEKTIHEIALLFGVADATVSSWAARYGLIEYKWRPFKTILGD